MSCSCNNCSTEVASVDVTQMNPVFEKYKNVRGSMIMILQEAQDMYGYLPVDLINYIGLKTGVKPAKILGIITFYSQFRLAPVGKNLIMQCVGTACYVNGSTKIAEAIIEELGIGDKETTADGLFTFNKVACLGCCSLSPVMNINGETFGKLTPESAKAIIRKIKIESENKTVNAN